MLAYLTLRRGMAEDYFYPPFEACIDRERGNSKGAMCSDAAQNGVPSCASELLMTQKP